MLRSQMRYDGRGRLSNNKLTVPLVSGASSALELTGPEVGPTLLGGSVGSKVFTWASSGCYGSYLYETVWIIRRH